MQIKIPEVTINPTANLYDQTADNEITINDKIVKNKNRIKNGRFRFENVQYVSSMVKPSTIRNIINAER